MRRHKHHERREYSHLVNELKEQRGYNSFSTYSEIHQGDIYYADLPYDRGAETRGNHPVLVVSSARMNSWSTLILVVPLTSNMSHRDKATHIPFQFVFGEGAKQSLALCEQLRALDKGFLTTGKIGEVNRRTLSTILDIIKEYELREDYA